MFARSVAAASLTCGVGCLTSGIRCSTARPIHPQENTRRETKLTVAQGSAVVNIVSMRGSTASPMRATAAIASSAYVADIGIDTAHPYHVVDRVRTRSRQETPRLGRQESVPATCCVKKRPKTWPPQRQELTPSLLLNGGIRRWQKVDQLDNVRIIRRLLAPQVAHAQ